ncbi:hypothetical protein SL103_02765 [Streptomyces lydicus]|uniref:Uncharacterized protein n=2 Tax=Streptomyces lydicus TaxID=47763 RepID=A0A1D7VVW3_9ACTN|nr:hypothetical protein SL103_02765 [Streptomyces lydicus]
MDPRPSPRLDAALERLAGTFRGMVAHPDEDNCECHWGGAEELARLKVADLALEPDLLRRTWQAVDWGFPAEVLRRILPQLAGELVAGRVEPLFGMEEVGRAFARGRWRAWPDGQAAAVREFLCAWWAHTLTDPRAAVPAHEVLACCAEASGALTPWLAAWAAQTGPVADRRLAEAVGRWECDLLRDELPWHAREGGDERRAELTDWLVRHAPARLRPLGAPEELLHRVRLLGLTGEARWEDPHWPGYRY